MIGCTFILIIVGATYMSEALMENRTLAVLEMCLNPILDEGISAIASAFGVCQLTFRSITNLKMKGNGGVTKEGTRLILQSAVNNGTCLQVELNEAYDEQVNKMLHILETRKEATLTAKNNVDIYT